MAPRPFSPTEDPEAPGQSLFREDGEDAGNGGGMGKRTPLQN